MLRNPIAIAVVAVIVAWLGVGVVKNGGVPGFAPAPADSSSHDAREEPAVVTAPVGRAAAPTGVLIPRADWPLRNVEVPETDRRGALEGSGYVYGDVGGVFTWRWTPPEAATRPVLLELLVYRTDDYAALRAQGRAAPTLVKGDELVVAYFQPRRNPFAADDPRHAQRESLRLTRLDLVDFAGKVRDKLRGRDPSLRVAVED